MRDTMNGVVLISGDFERTGGMDMANFALAQHLANRGESVQLVAYRVADELAKHSNVRWRKVPKPLKSYFFAAPLLDRVGRRIARGSLNAGGRVVANGGNCRANDVNWVHYVHAAYEPSLRGALARRAKSKLTRRLNLERERAALRSARIVIANSERTRRDLIRCLDVNEARIHTIYLGIDSAQFFPPSAERKRQLREHFGWPDRPQVVFVGALGDRRKGFDTLFAAWTNLCRDPGWDADLVVVGTGAEEAQWKERAVSQGMGGRVQFMGFRKDVPAILAACDAMVAPTRYEPFGLGVQEALCTGLPALVSADAGVAEVYPAELSELLLNDAGNASALESALRNWRKHHDRLHSATHQFSERLRKRTWEKMAEEIYLLIR